MYWRLGEAKQARMNRGSWLTVDRFRSVVPVALRPLLSQSLPIHIEFIGIHQIQID